MGFKDHFSTQSKDYSIYRPGYPAELFQYLGSIAASRNTAWDCATGTGQAAVTLADYFDRVIASDPSAGQIANAVRKKNIEYHVFPAEHADIPDSSIDLITVAQALHWFDFDGFYDEAYRVLRPDGIIAAWCYELFTIDSRIDAVINNFYAGILGDYWPPERRYIREKYATIPFPFALIESPSFTMRALWNADDVIGYLGTWSAVKNYSKKTGSNPIDLIVHDLATAWGDTAKHRDISWDIQLKVGKLLPERRRAV